MNHDKAVEKHFEAAEKAVEDGLWDSVFREVEYFEEQSAPHPPRPDDKGVEVGEFDVLCVNYDRKLAFYKEVKTNPAHRGYGREQVERAEDFFKDSGWEVYGCVVVDPVSSSL